MIRVYCAGKISQDDWRQSIFPELRGPRYAGRPVEWPAGEDRIRQFPPEGPQRAEFVYVGPYFINCGCNHGSDGYCYQGRSDHGVGANEYTESNHGALCGPEGPSRREVVDLCLRWLQHADAVFAWLDDPTAYGTIAEIGYAYGRGIPVWLYRPYWGSIPEERAWGLDDAWFVNHLAVRIGETLDAETAFEHFMGDARRDLRLLYLKRMPYDEYLRTAEWKATRERKLAEAGHRCQLCNSTGNVHAHHRTYERLGEESLADLIALCGSCHAVFHGRLRLDTERGALRLPGDNP